MISITRHLSWWGLGWGRKVEKENVLYTSPSEGGGKKKMRQGEERKGCTGGTFYTKLMATIPVFLASLQKQPHLTCTASLSITEQLYQIHSFLFY